MAATSNIAREIAEMIEARQRDLNAGRHTYPDKRLANAANAELDSLWMAIDAAYGPFKQET